MFVDYGQDLETTVAAGAPGGVGLENLEIRWTFAAQLLVKESRMTQLS